MSIGQNVCVHSLRCAPEIVFKPDTRKEDKLQKQVDSMNNNKEGVA